MSIPIITLQMSRNGGAQQTGGITAALNDVVVLSIVGTGINIARYELIGPVGFSCPAGWSTAADGTFYVVTNGSAAPSFTLNPWGKYVPKVTTNNGQRNKKNVTDQTDTRCLLTVISPVSGLHEVGIGEEAQVDALRRWVGPINAAIRKLETLSVGADTNAVKIQSQDVDAATLAGAQDADIMYFDNAAAKIKMGKTLTQLALAAAFTFGLKFANTTAADAGAPVQASPALAFEGRWWDTTASGTARSQTWLVQARRASTTTNGELAFYGDDGTGGGSVQVLGLRRSSTAVQVDIPPGSAASVLSFGTLASLTAGVAGVFGTLTGLQIGGAGDIFVRAGGINHATNTAGIVALYGGNNSGAGPDGRIDMGVGTTRILSVYLDPTFTAGAIQFDGDAISSFFGIQPFSTGANPGRDLYIGGGISGSTGDLAGGNLVLVGGTHHLNGTRAEVRLATYQNTPVVRVGTDASNNSLLSLFNATPVVKQVLAGLSGEETTASLVSALNTYGMLTTTNVSLFGRSEPRRVFEIEEDFIDGDYSTPTAPVWARGSSYFAGIIGGTAATSAALNGNTSNIIGAVVFTAGTGGGGTSYAGAQASSGDYSNGAACTPDTNNEILVEWRIYLPNLSDGTNTYRVYAGLSNGGSTGFPTIGAWIDYLSTSSANWRMGTNNGGATTLTNSSVAVTAAAWHRLTALKRAGSATLWEFFVDGVSIGTQSTNAPTSQPIYAMAKIESIAGGVARTMRVDWCRYSVRWPNTARAA